MLLCASLCSALSNSSLISTVNTSWAPFCLQLTHTHGCMHARRHTQALMCKSNQAVTAERAQRTHGQKTPVLFRFCLACASLSLTQAQIQKCSLVFPMLLWATSNIVYYWLAFLLWRRQMQPWHSPSWSRLLRSIYASSLWEKKQVCVVSRWMWGIVGLHKSSTGGDSSIILPFITCPCETSQKSLE